MRDGGLIAGIDLATAYGWALGRPGEPPLLGHGTFGISGSDAAVGYACLSWASDFFALHRPSVVFIEEPVLIQHRGARRAENPKTLKRLWKLCGIVETIAYARGVYDVRFVTVDAVRRHFIGMKQFLPGPKAKALTQERCTALGWHWTHADEADAAAIFAYGCEQVSPGSGQKPGALPIIETGDGRAIVRPRQPQETISAKEAAEKYFRK